MGYSTEFSGELKFTKELTAGQLVKLGTFFGEDCRNHPEWNSENLTWMDLKLTKDATGIVWDGSEKTYDLTEKVNLILSEMRKDYPDFGLSGKMLCQGEDINDRWILMIENGIAVCKEIDSLLEQKVTCPHCNEQFVI
jgi:hypothetical protein